MSLRRQTFTFYNPVGECAGSSGRGFAWLLDGMTHSLDRALPCLPIFVFPYIAAYAMPFVLVWLMYRNGATDAVMGSARRFVFAQVLMMCAAFACYMAFPVKCANQPRHALRSLPTSAALGTAALTP